MLRLSIIYAFVLILAVISCGLVFSAEEKSSSKKTSSATPSKITVSQETTRYTEPLREDGSLDCVAILNEIAGKDVTPENNAAVLLWQAIGPKEIPKESREKFFKILGTTCPPEKGEYLVEPYETIDPTKPESETEKLYERLSGQLDAAMKKPWSEEEYPELAATLRKNEKPLRLILEAAQRPKFYSPLIATKDEMLSTLDISLISPLRDLSKLLVARAMLQLKRGREKECWRELIACYRLGRLRSQGPLWLDLAIGSALQASAADGMAAFAYHTEIKADHLQKYLADLAELPSANPVERIYDEGERVFDMGSIYDIANHPQTISQYIHFKEENTKKALQKLALDPKMDWNEVLREDQEGFDYTLTALKLSNFPDANRALSKIHAEDREELQKAWSRRI